MSLIAAREGWREPIDFEVERNVFLLLLSDAQKFGPVYPIGYPMIRFPFFRPMSGASFTSKPMPESVSRDTVDLSLEVAEQGIRFYAPTGMSTVRMKPKDREEMCTQIRELSR